MFSLVRCILFVFAINTTSSAHKLRGGQEHNGNRSAQKLRGGQQHNGNRRLQINRFQDVRDLVFLLEGDFTKFYIGGNQSAGTRVRRGMQDLKNLAQDIRVEVQQIQNDNRRLEQLQQGHHQGHRELSARFDQVKDLVLSLEGDFDQFYDLGGNNQAAAGTRVRKGMQELKNLAQDIRVEIQQIFQILKKRRSIVDKAWYTIRS